MFTESSRLALFGGQPTPCPQQGKRLQQQIARWVADNRQLLADADPDMSHLPDRIDDHWTPLYAIAKVVGDNWPDLAEVALKALTPSDDDTDSLGEKLIHDIHRAFDNRSAPAAELTPDAMIDRLVAMTGRPWAEFGKTGKPLTKNKLSRSLTDFGVCLHREWDPKTQKMGPQVYRMNDFADAFARYPLPANG
jgi:Protein of unknown function (DUF3631)